MSFTNREVPTPEERLCLVHNKPIIPSRWLRGSRQAGCNKCVNENKRSPKLRARRIEKWHSQFIPCINHPDVRCMRSQYVHDGKRKCASCSVRGANGEYHPSFVKVQNKMNYARSMKLRRSLRGKLRGLKLFERLTGMKLPEVWHANQNRSM